MKTSRTIVLGERLSVSWSLDWSHLYSYRLYTRGACAVLDGRTKIGVRGGEAGIRKHRERYELHDNVIEIVSDLSTPPCGH